MGLNIRQVLGLREWLRLVLLNSYSKLREGGPFGLEVLMKRLQLEALQTEKASLKLHVE